MASKAVIFVSWFRPRHTRNPGEESYRDDGQARHARRQAQQLAQASGEAARAAHSDISKRAYFLHLEEGEHDALGHWLRVEQELRTP